MDYTAFIEVGAPVVVRSYVSGVMVGKLVGGGGGVVALRDWRYLREWSGVGGAGSIYDLVASDKAATSASALVAMPTVVHQADVMQISEEAYARLTG